MHYIGVMLAPPKADTPVLVIVLLVVVIIATLIHVVLWRRVK